MRHPALFRAIPLIACGCLLAAGCAERQKLYTLTKDDVSQPQLIQDEQVLRDTSGVKNVIHHHDSANTVTIELFLESGNTAPGLQVATDLGYKQVRN